MAFLDRLQLSLTDSFHSRQVPFGGRYPGLMGEVTTGRFITTIHAINSGIIKLSVLTPVITVYRGMSGLKLPHELETPTKFGSLLGIEYGECRCFDSNCAVLDRRRLTVRAGFMSTTTDKEVAVHYGQDTWSGKDLGYVLEFALDTLNRGALIQ